MSLHLPKAHSRSINVVLTTRAVTEITDMTFSVISVGKRCGCIDLFNSYTDTTPIFFQ